MKNFPIHPVTLDNRDIETDSIDPFGEPVPANGVVTYMGLTALDYFAGEAMNGMIAEGTPLSLESEIANWSYSMAAAMMKERERWL